jgi:hypothetical protein
MCAGERFAAFSASKKMRSSLEFRRSKRPRARDTNGSIDRVERVDSIERVKLLILFGPLHASAANSIRSIISLPYLIPIAPPERTRRDLAFESRSLGTSG